MKRKQEVIICDNCGETKTRDIPYSYFKAKNKFCDSICAKEYARKHRDN